MNNYYFDGGVQAGGKQKKGSVRKKKEMESEKRTFGPAQT